MRNSNLIAQSSVELVKIVQDSFGSIRDIILDKSFDKKTSNYKSKDIIYRLNTADNYFYRAFPRYALETIGITDIINCCDICCFFKNSNFIPTLGFIALAAQRLLPVYQIISHMGVYQRY